jgi:acetamidase/formamidase
MTQYTSHMKAFISSVAFAVLISPSVVAQQVQPQTHAIKWGPKTVQWGWFDGSKAPVLTVNSGDIVDLESPLAASREMEMFGMADRITPEMRALETGVPDADKGPGANILVGPIYVNGAKPGDVLEVKILSLDPVNDYAVNLFTPKHGALTEDIPVLRVKIVPLDRQRNVAVFAPGIEMPTKPFFGTMGVAPAVMFGRISDSPPDYYAGNLDNKDLVAGTTLYIPVQVDGALFAAGDGHAGQGDGEVDGTAIEIGLRGRLQLTVRKDLHFRWPRAETPDYYMTMGFDPDLNRAAVQAVREMVDLISTRYSLSREDAYMLTSMAADLHVTQIVDGTKGIHAMMPKKIFVQH